MPQSRTRYIGMDVHKDLIAVAYSAKDHDAQVIYLGTIGTRHGDLDTLIRTMHSKAKHLVFVSEAGPCGYWLDRDLTKTGSCLLGRRPRTDAEKGWRPRDNRPSGCRPTCPPDALR